MAFRFKQFYVNDSACAMKVGTDAVLLGAWAELDEAETILDIGTGCGLIALMAAQRCLAHITAVEPVEAACGQAAENFGNSPWAVRLQAICVDLQTFADRTELQFDRILSNPPFFTGSLKPEDPGRKLARHTDNLSYETLVQCAARLLKPHGSLSVIIPYDSGSAFRQAAAKAGLFPAYATEVVPKEGKPANRVLLDFRHKPVADTERNTLIIRNSDGSYSDGYTRLTKDFYLNF